MNVCAEPFAEEAKPPTSPGTALSGTGGRPGQMHIAFGSRIFDQDGDCRTSPSPAREAPLEEDVFPPPEERILTDREQVLLAQYLDLRRLYRPRECKYTGEIYAEAWNTPGVRKRHGQYSHRGDELLYEEEEGFAQGAEEEELEAAFTLLLSQPQDLVQELERLEKRRQDDLTCTRRCVRTGLLYTEKCNTPRAARYCPGKIHPGGFWTCCGQKESEALPCRAGRHEDRPAFAVFYAQYQMGHNDLIAKAEKWSDSQAETPTSPKLASASQVGLTQGHV